VIVRIAVITESFPPDVNGVAHCVLRVAEHLVRRGHQPLVIAPRPAEALPQPDSAVPYPVVRVPSLPMPCYPGFRIASAGPGLRAALTGHGTKLVHLASPFVLGGGGAVTAARLRLRRCTDLVPGLVVMAIRERWSGEDPASATMEHAASGPRAPQAQ
jgi:phosphatidylinositol alpha 1,6-mannosyltransferase